MWTLPANGDKHAGAAGVISGDKSEIALQILLLVAASESEEKERFVQARKAGDLAFGIG